MLFIHRPWLESLFFFQCCTHNSNLWFQVWLTMWISGQQQLMMDVDEVGITMLKASGNKITDWILVFLKMKKILKRVSICHNMWQITSSLAVLFITTLWKLYDRDRVSLANWPEQITHLLSNLHNVFPLTVVWF